VISVRWMLAVAATVAACVSARAAAPRSLDLPEGTFVAPGKAADLELFSSGDVIGYVEDCGCKLNPAGGLSRRQWILDQIKKTYPGAPIALLDTGNFSDNPTPEGSARTRMLLESMAKLGYKAAGVGERDLALGYDDFKKLTNGIALPFVSTNIVTEGTLDPVFPPYTIVTVAGKGGSSIRLGVLSVVRYNPVWQKSGPHGTNLAIAQPLAMLKRYAPEVRAKSDILIVLASLAKDDAYDLPRQIPGIDLVLAAYGGIYSTVEEKIGETPVLYLGNQGKRIAETRIMVDGAKHVSELTTYMHFLTARYPEDPTMKSAVASLKSKTGPAPEER
jgi:2',3'-cyclic-nucleotide 2'-phosphodiesterase (5'-nucleotidase family)